MKKLWLAVLALLLVTPLFALNSEEKSKENVNARQMAIDLGVILISQEVGGFTEEEFPADERSMYAENVREFLEDPVDENFYLEEISAVMLDIWLAEQSEFFYEVRNSVKLRQELLKEVVKPGTEIKAEKRITEQAKWYNDAVQRAQAWNEEDMKEQKRNIILQKLKENRMEKPTEPKEARSLFPLEQRPMRATP